MNIMKIVIPILAALFVVGTELMARAALQGMEQALVSTVVEWSVNKFNVVRKMIG